MESEITEIQKFTPPRNRDAFAVIRGYVYQVDTTILKWLALLEDEILILECGEDLDKISKVLGKDNEERERVLEQIKHREANLTLRSPECVEAIANFSEHRSTNPSSKLTFLFTTTGKVGQERPSPFEDRLPCIEVWESIRRRKLSGVEKTMRLTGIRSLLRSVARPADMPDTTWNVFKEIANATDVTALSDLISRFEWSTGNVDALTIGESIQSQLLREGVAEDGTDARAKYERLFLYIFKLLCRAGHKSLSAADRRAQLAMPSLAASDRKILSLVVKQVTSLEERLVMVEGGVQIHAQKIASIQRQMRQVTGEKGIDGSVTFAHEALVLEIPPRVERGSVRKEAVQRLGDCIAAYTWTDVRGGSGTGKTQLAVLVALAGGNCAAWVRMRGLDSAQGATRLDQFCKTAAAPSSDASLLFSAADAFAHTAKGDLVVIDDLPRMTADDGMSARLSLMVHEAAARGVRLLTTSVHSVPTSLRDQLGESLAVTEVPPLTDEEVREILTAYGAPSKMLGEGMIRLLNGLARQHPALLSAIARYLRRERWNVSNDTLTALFCNAHMSEMNDETTGRLLITVHDGETRSLLYRLNLVHRSFTEREVACVTECMPRIDRPRERLSLLTNLWVQRDIKERFSVSPLVKALGTSDLKLATKSECLKRLGDLIIEKRILSQLDALDAILYYTAGGHEMDAARVFLTALQGLQQAPINVEDGGLLLLWNTTPLPEGINKGLRIFIRGLQVAVLEKFGRDYSFVLADFDRQMDDASADMSWAIVGGITACILTAGKTDARRANRYLSKALRLYPRVMETMDGESPFPSDMAFEQIVWVNVGNIVTPEDLDDWTSLIEGMSEEQRTKAFDSKMGSEGSVMVGMRVPLLEGQKPDEEQDWDSVLSTLKVLEDRAEKLGLEILWAGAVRAQITVLAQRLNDLKGAEDVARFALGKTDVSPRSEFLVRSALGEAYVDKRQWDAAAKELVDILNFDIQGLPFELFNALLSGSISVGQTDPSTGLVYARKAVAVAEDTEHFPDTEIAKALCELAVAEWLVGDMVKSFAAFDRAAGLLFEQSQQTDRWKDLMVVFGHCAGYVAQIAMSGQPPEYIADETRWEPPQRGVFRIMVKERVDYYETLTKTRPAAVEMTLLAMFAEAVGNHERAAYWAMRGMDASRNAGMTISQGVLSAITIPCFLEMEDFGAAMDAGVEAGIVSMACDVARRAGESIVTTDFRPMELLGERPNENWKQADIYTAGFSLVPAVLRICTIALDDRDRARQLGEDLAGICRLLGEKGTDKLLWAQAAESIASAFSFEFGQVEMIKRGNAIVEERYRSVRVICYMGATVQHDSIPEEAIQGHLAVIGYLLPLLGGLRSMYQRILLPFFSRYWRRAFEQSRFRFRTPRHVEQALANAMERPLEMRVSAILRVMADGLGIPLSPDLQRLLKEDE